MLFVLLLWGRGRGAGGFVVVLHLVCLFALLVVAIVVVVVVFQTHDCVALIRIACIRPLTMNSLTDSNLIAWLCPSHIHRTLGYWTMNGAHDGYHSVPNIYAYT